MHIELRADHATISRLEQALADREQAAKHVTPALDAIAKDFLTIQRRRFAGGAGWKPLTAEWAVRKARGGKPSTPLTGGALEASLTRAGARFAVRRTSKGTVTLGTSDPVAHLHRDGTGHLPRRPPVSISRADERRWVNIFRDHLAGAETRRIGL